MHVLSVNNDVLALTRVASEVTVRAVSSACVAAELIGEVPSTQDVPEEEEEADDGDDDGDVEQDVL